LIERLLTSCSKIFAAAEYATTQIPTYPCGQIGFLLLTKQPKKRTRAKVTSKKARPVTEEEQARLNYYTPELHAASFVLPAFVQRTIDVVNEQDAKNKQESKKTQRKGKATKKTAAEDKPKSKKRKAPKKAEEDDEDVEDEAEE